MANKSSGAGGSTGMKATIFLGAALVAGIAATVVTWQVFAAYRAQIDAAIEAEETQYVIVAYADLYQGVTITEEDLFAIEIPPKYLFEEGKEESGLFKSHEHVVGRMPRERILANEFIREERLADPEAGIGLNATIPRGMRAISINLDHGRALSGFLQPANYVDVLVTIAENRSDNPETHLLLQAVYVLAVNDQTRKRGPEKPIEEGVVQNTKKRKIKPSVTLAVTPGQAEQIAHADHEGRLTLTLRNDLDDVQTDATGVTTKTITGDFEPQVKPRPRGRAKPKPKTGGITIIEGDQKIVYTTDQAGNVTKSGR